MDDLSWQLGFSEPEKKVSPEKADVLRNSRRRGVIRLLSDEKTRLSSLADSLLGRDPECSISKEEAVEKIAFWENGDVNSLGSEHLNRTRVSLLQHHLSRLEEENIVNYRDEDSIIEGNYPEIKNYIDFVEDEPSGETSFREIEVHKTPYLTANQAFDILSNERRQRTLNYIDETEEEPVEASSIAEYIASIEEDLVTSDKRKSVYINLIQNHLPRMDSCQVLDYDEDRKKVFEGSYFEPLSDFISI